MRKIAKSIGLNGVAAEAIECPLRVLMRLQRAAFGWDGQQLFSFSLSLQPKVCLPHYHHKAILLDQCWVLNRTRCSHCRRPLGWGEDGSVNQLFHRCFRSAHCHSERNTTAPAAPPLLPDRLDNRAWLTQTYSRHSTQLTSTLSNLTFSHYGISSLCTYGSYAAQKTKNKALIYNSKTWTWT